MSMKKMEAIKELVEKGELGEQALRWHNRGRRGDEESRKIQAENRQKHNKNKSIAASDIKSDKYSQHDTVPLTKHGVPRLYPHRWTTEEHKILVDCLFKFGKNWNKVASFVKTKNEQQCRTRGGVMYNKLKENCFDEKLYEILKPRPMYGHHKTSSVKKTEMVKSEENDGISFANALMGNTRKEGA